MYKSTKVADLPNPLVKLYAELAAKGLCTECSGVGTYHVPSRAYDGTESERVVSCPKCGGSGKAAKATKTQSVAIDSAAASVAEYGVTLAHWRKACKAKYKPYGEDGPVAICTRIGVHSACIFDLPKSYQEPKKTQYNPKHNEEQTMAKKTDENKGGTETTTAKAPKGKKAAETPAAPKGGGRKGNPEALAKAREASAESREASRARKIKVLAKENPKREGSAAAHKFSLYRNGMTVGEFLEAGGTMSCLNYDVKHEYIEVK